MPAASQADVAAVSAKVDALAAKVDALAVKVAILPLPATPEQVAELTSLVHDVQAGVVAAQQVTVV